MKLPNETTSIVHPSIDVLRKLGCLAWRNNTGAAKLGERFIRFGVPGLPDIIGVLPGGRMLAIECKRTKGKLTPAQSATLERFGAQGVAVAVVTDARQVVELVQRWTRNGECLK